MLHLDDVEP